VGGWVGGWWVVVVVESEFSDRFGYSLRLALAKPNKKDNRNMKGYKHVAIRHYIIHLLWFTLALAKIIGRVYIQGH
jgi:hypothetical protein